MAVWGHKLNARKDTKQNTELTDLASTISEPTISKDEQETSKSEDKKSKEHHVKYIKVDREGSKNLKEIKEDASQDLSTSFADDEERHDESSEQLVSIAESEKSFRRHFQSITHRMIHRRASMELYKRIMNNTFGKNI